MNKRNIDNLKKKIEDYFFRGEYDKAMRSIALALEKSPNDKELELCAILSDMATENEEKAQAIFEYYQISKSIDEDIVETIEGLIESADFDVELFNRLLGDMNNSNDSMEDYSINYNDFIAHINERGSFKRAYEDIMFSTKVLINSKDDFIDFLNKLVDNGYIESAFGYCEAAVTLFPKDIKLQDVFKKIKDKSSENS